MKAYARDQLKMNHPAQSVVVSSDEDESWQGDESEGALSDHELMYTLLSEQTSRGIMDLDEDLAHSLAKLNELKAAARAARGFPDRATSEEYEKLRQNLESQVK